MINIFTIPQTDQSVIYLGQIFGYVGNVLTPSGATLILGAMFKVFNTVVLSVGALIVLYVTIVGVMKTAHEGEFLGKQWNSIWIPIRMVIGIAALVPSPTGYCAIQMVIMWIVLQGVGAADQVWSAVLNYTDIMGSPLSTITIPSVTTESNMQSLFQSLVCQATARSPYSIDAPGGGGYFCDPKGGNASSGFCQLSADGSGMLKIDGPQSFTSMNVDKKTVKDYLLNYQMGPDGACGVMTFCNPQPTCQVDQSKLENQIKCNACTAQKDALQQTVLLLGSVGQAFASADFTFRQAYQSPTPITDKGIQAFCSAQGLSKEQCCRPLSPTQLPFMPASVQKCALPTNISAGDANNAWADTVQQLYWPFMIKESIGGDNDIIGAAADNYTSVLTTAVTNTIFQGSDRTPTNAALQQAKEVGWIFAGAYYYRLAQMNDKNIDAAMPVFSIASYSPKSNTENVLHNIRNNFDAAGDLLETPGAAFSGSSGGGGEDVISASMPKKIKGLQKITKGMKSSANNIMSTFEKMTTGAGTGKKATNPLAQLQTLGKVLLIVAQALFALIFAVIATLSILGYLSVLAAGTGVINPVGGTITTLSIIFGPILTLLLGALFLFGATLAVYVPLIPYIIFTMGAVAWMILIVEAMVAAPIVALGILMPSGHDLLGKADHALMLVFGIFLRPTLMIFGMIAAMLMSVVVVTMINAGFSGVMGSIYKNPGLVELFLFMAAYVGIIVSALNKCFALIHIIPDQTLRWIGAHGAGEGGAGVSEVMAGAKGGVQAAGGEMQRGGGAAVGKAHKAGLKAEGELEAKRKQKGGEGKPTIGGGA